MIPHYLHEDLWTFAEEWLIDHENDYPWVPSEDDRDAFKAMALEMRESLEAAIEDRCIEFIPESAKPEWAKERRGK